MNKDLQPLFELFEENIKQLLALCEGRTLVFDFDGTLTRFQYAKDRMLPCRDEDIEQYTKDGGNIYENIYILKTMKYIMSLLNKNDVYILTSTVVALRPIKDKIIVDNFAVWQNHIIHTHNSAEKLDVLHKIYEKTGREIIFFEDNYKILLNCEENTNFVKGYHISRLLP